MLLAYQTPHTLTFPEAALFSFLALTGERITAMLGGDSQKEDIYCSMKLKQLTFFSLYDKLVLQIKLWDSKSKTEAAGAGFVSFDLKTPNSIVLSIISVSHVPLSKTPTANLMV